LRPAPANGDIATQPMASVLHVVSYFPPDRIGGVGEVVSHVHRGLLAGGHRSRVVTSGHSRDDAQVLRIARTPAGFSLASARALQLAREADVIHVHHGEALGLLVGLQLLRIETPVLLTLHVNVAAMAAASRPYRAAGQSLGSWNLREAAYVTLAMPLRELADRAAMALSDATSFISRSAAFDTLGAEAAARATVIYNGLPASAGVREAATACDLLFVGTNQIRKRVETLPLVLAAVRERRPRATLRIVGFTAEENPRLLRLAQRLGVADAIEFAGRVRAEDIAAHYASAGVLLVPSAYEGLPMVILEAMQQGLPCVATRVSGHPEVIASGENGLLVPLDNPVAMAAAALEILDQPTRRQQLAESAKRTVHEQFELSRQVREYSALYARLRGAA
jgi:glycosyltransferase involved in cell wall biosynthesis